MTADAALPDGRSRSVTPPLRVGFDVTALASGRTGVARCVRELGAALERRGIELARFAIGRAVHGDESGLTDAVRYRVPLRIVHRTWRLVHAPSAERLAAGAQVVHSPDLIPPPTRLPLIMTVHDLDALARPDLHPRRSVTIQRAQLVAAQRRAAFVLTPSQASASILRERGVDPERVVVAPWGVVSLPRADRSLVPDGPYVLSVGGMVARKGFDVLVRAFARGSLDNLQLVLAGPDDSASDGIEASIARHGLGQRVVRARAVSDAQLAGLYEGALTVCVPSLAEGFGLPVLEAAAAGATVIATDLPALRELGEAVAAFVPPGDDLALAAAIERVVADEHVRRQSSTRGPAFAATYTWDRTADIVISTYRRALELR